MNIYKHTQAGRLMITVMGIAAAVLIAVSLFTYPTAMVGVPVLALTAWIFCSLTVEVADGELRWRFGPGLIRRRVRLDEIVSAEPVRTGFIDGWGIHWGRFGWLYNVSGYDAVAIRLRNGKRFALGTDEPRVLAQCLQPKEER